MSRILIALAAVTLTALTFAPAVFAAGPAALQFELEPRRDAPHRAQLSLYEGGRRNSVTGSDFTFHQLGLAPNSLKHDGSRPLRFALVRDAGRADCAGTAQRGRGTGQCRFTPNPAFTALLARHGVRLPSQRQGMGLILVGVSRGLVEALRQARYPVPTVDQLSALAALNVTPAYIAELARRGYRPERLNDLIAFKALDISPAYIDAMTRAGFGKITAGEIVQLKALDVSPEFVAALRRAGYRDLRAGEVVQLRALDVTAAYVTELRSLGIVLPVSKLIQYKALGFSPRAIAASRKVPRKGRPAASVRRIFIPTFTSVAYA